MENFIWFMFRVMRKNDVLWRFRDISCLVASVNFPVIWFNVICFFINNVKLFFKKAFCNIFWLWYIQIDLYEISWLYIIQHHYSIYLFFCISPSQTLTTSSHSEPMRHSRFSLLHRLPVYCGQSSFGAQAFRIPHCSKMTEKLLCYYCYVPDSVSEETSSVGFNYLKPRFH